MIDVDFESLFEFVGKFSGAFIFLVYFEFEFFGNLLDNVFQGKVRIRVDLNVQRVFLLSGEDFLKFAKFLINLLKFNLNSEGKNF